MANRPLTLATRTRSEIENAEAERLVRPLPKKKPPRRDRRRERMQVDRDPDVDGDPDVASDPDLSLNFKSIGSVVSRFLLAQERVPAKNRETGATVYVAPETLKKEPGKYEPLKGGDAEQKAPKDAPEISPLGRKLLESVHGDERLLSHLRSVAAPEQLGGLAKTNPNFPLDKLGEVGKQLAESTGAKTIGEVARVLADSGGLKSVERAFKKKPTESKPQATQVQPSKTEPDVKPAEPKSEAHEPKSEARESPEDPSASTSDREKKKKDKKPGASIPPPSEAAQAGIGEPERRQASEAERMAANTLIMDTFPRKVATQLLLQNLHPDDVAELATAYTQTQALPVKDIKSFAEDAKKFYQTDPDRVPPPTRGKNALGQEVPFTELSPAEQADSYRKHQMRVVAASHAIQGKLADELSMPSWLGKPRVPAEVASTLASFVLTKDRTEDSGSEWSQKLFDRVSASGEAVDMPPKLVKKLLGSLPPDAAEVARGFLTANDFNTARAQFLESGAISEYQRPKTIFKGLKSANDFFTERAKVYGSERHEGALNFRVAVLGQLRTLDPEKHKQVQALFDREDADAYDKARQAYDRELKAWQKRMQAWGASQDPYRGRPFSEEPPEEPRKPPRYALVQSPKTTRQEGAALFNDLVGLSKTARAVPQKVISFYPPPKRSSETVMTRKAVYHGIDPKMHERAPNQGWAQPHARDFGEADCMLVLAAAQEWLRQPVLSGFDRDAQLRAALDLGLQTSNYRVSPQLYDQLLARLSGEPAPARFAYGSSSAPTLSRDLSKRESSCPLVIHRETTQKGTTMPAKLSANQKKAADEVLGLLDKVAATIQENHSKWGMSFDAARGVVNELDKVADNVEISAYGAESLRRRQVEILAKTAKVIQQDADELYMSTFNAPSAVRQQDADELYMSAYGDDQSSAIAAGKDKLGKPLVGR